METGLSSFGVNMKNLLERCLEAINECLDELRNERTIYDGYPKKLARFDRHIGEYEDLKREVEAAINAS